MSVTLAFTVEDIDTQILTYNSIRVYRADSLGGSYSAQGTTALVAGTYHYTYADATGDLNKWYKYSLYHTGTTAESDLSAPFRPDGVTLRRMRQRCLEDYGLGMVLTSSASAAGTITADDYRVRSSQYPSSRGKGSYVMPTSGTYAGQARKVTSLTQASGTFNVDPAWGGAPGTGVEFEWTWICDFHQLDVAARRALDRYWYVDRVPIVGVADQKEYTLTNLPWLRSRRHILNLNVLFSGATEEVEWGVSGRWWGSRVDRDIIVLQINPAIAAADTLYLEGLRQMPPLYTDASAAPNICDEAYAAGLMYDEVLAYLSRPGSAPQVDRADYIKARAQFVPELRRLSRARWTDPRHASPQFATPAVAPRPWSAR